MFVVRTGCNSISIPWDCKQHLYSSSMCPEINGITLSLKHVMIGPWAWWGQRGINWLQLWADAEFQVELYWMPQIDHQTRIILACRTVSREANPASYRVSPTVWIQSQLLWLVALAAGHLPLDMQPGCGWYLYQSSLFLTITCSSYYLVFCRCVYVSVEKMLSVLGFCWEGITRSLSANPGERLSTVDLDKV